MNIPVSRLPILLVLIIVVVGGCSSATSPGWTFAPAPLPASPLASPSAPPASPGPTASAPAASASVPPAPDATAADVVRIAADNIAFDQAELSVPADRPFSVVFENREPVPHNVAIYTDASAAQALFVGEIFAGPGERTYAVPALAAGTYFYRCDVHPTQMKGTLVAR